MSAGPGLNRAPSRAAAAGQLALELPLELPAIALAPEWKDQQRLWGHSFHPMCSYLASFPAALTHAFIARYSRPGDVVLDPFSGRGTTPAPGLRRGPDRRRERPQPVRPPADRVQGPPGDARRGRRPGSPSSAWPGTPRRRLARRWRARVIADPGGTLVPRAGSGDAAAGATRPCPPRSPSRSTRTRWPSSCSCGRRSDLDDRTDAFLAAAITGILHGKSASYLSELMPNTFSMAPRYVREFAARTAFASPRRDVFDGLAAKLDRLFRQPPPADRGRRAPGRRPRRRAAGPRGPARARPPGPGPARRHLAALPAGRQVRLLQLAAHVVPRASTPARSTRPSTTPITASRTSRSCARSSPASARSSPTTRSSCSSSATSRPTAVGASRAASASPSAPGSRPPSPRAIGSRASRSTTSRPLRKMTKLWGAEAGRATKTDRILVLGATEAGRRRALAERRRSTSTGPGRRGRCAPSEVGGDPAPESIRWPP